MTSLHVDLGRDTWNQPPASAQHCIEASGMEEVEICMRSGSPIEEIKREGYKIKGVRIMVRQEKIDLFQ